jgi:ubiquinone/menaquinone biosynthesis C-methylase UbiE
MPTELEPEGAEFTALLETASFKQARVLEVGSGDGRLAFRYAKASASVVGIEPDVTQLTLARRACPVSLRRRVTFVQATALALPFRSATFDIAVLAWSL